MLQKIMSVLGKKADGSDHGGPTTRRVFPRRASDRCVGIINGLMMPVLDWSQGGVRVMGDTRTIALGQEMDFTLKFKMKDQMIDVQHRGQVVRKSTDNFALKFMPMNLELKRTLQSIIDEATLNDIASSGA